MAGENGECPGFKQALELGEIVQDRFGQWHRIFRKTMEDRDGMAGARFCPIDRCPFCHRKLDASRKR